MKKDTIDKKDKRKIVTITQTIKYANGGEYTMTFKRRQNGTNWLENYFK